MKKSLIALAVFGMFTGAALADGNSVTLYGKIDAGVTHFTGLAPAGGGAGTVSSTGLSSGITGGDRIGVKGTEDLGGGLKVLFDAETGFCGTGNNQMNKTNAASAQTFCTGSGYFMGRQAYLGMTGDFGTVLAGRLYDAIFGAEATLDPFGAGYTGQSANLDVVVAQLGLIRANQAVAYVTPNLSGFTGTFAYVLAAGKGTVAQASTTVANTASAVVGYTASGEPIYASTTTNAGAANVPRAFDLKGEYANGPIYAVLDYAQVSNAVTNSAGLNDGKVKVWVAGASYDFGVAKVVAEYQTAKKDYHTGKTDFWMLGATVPVGAGSILASYGSAKNDMDGLTNATAKQYAIGYTYNLSKQTSLYTSYAHLTNDLNTAYTVGDATDAFGAGIANQASSGFAVGMVHNF